jgi:DNA gyrase subunit A
VVAAFPIEENDELVLVTDGGQLIRSPVHDIRIAGRSTRGVTLFRVGAEERVVSVARLEEVEDTENGDGRPVGDAEDQANAEAEDQPEGGEEDQPEGGQEDQPDAEPDDE